MGLCSQLGRSAQAYHAQLCFLHTLCCLLKHKWIKTVECFQFFNRESGQYRMVSWLWLWLRIGFTACPILFLKYPTLALVHWLELSIKVVVLLNMDELLPNMNWRIWVRPPSCLFFFFFVISFFLLYLASIFLCSLRLCLHPLLPRPDFLYCTNSFTLISSRLWTSPSCFDSGTQETKKGDGSQIPTFG